MREVLLPAVAVNVLNTGLSVSAASAATGVSVQDLRYYEREGLLLNATPRVRGGRRRYTRADLEWVAGLVMLRETGMTIANIRVLADLSRRESTERERLAFFEKHRAVVLSQLTRTRHHLAAIEATIAAYRAAEPDQEEDQ